VASYQGGKLVPGWATPMVVGQQHSSSQGGVAGWREGERGCVMFVFFTWLQ